MRLLGIALGLMGLVVLSFAVGFHINQPSLVANSAGEVRSAAEGLDKAVLEAQNDPRDIREQLSSIREYVRSIRDVRIRDSLIARLDAIQQRLREQNDQLAASLWQTHEKAYAIRHQLDERLAQPSSVFVTAYDQFKRFLMWVGPIGLAAILLVISVLCQPSVRRWLSRAQSFSIGGLAINVHDPNAVREGVRERFQEVDDAIAEAYLDKLEYADMEELFSTFKDELDAQFGIAGINLSTIPHRATLWVPGFTGDELVQATSYLGTKPPSTRPVIGRRFSARYGIIGRAWRLRTTLYNWDVNNRSNGLIRYWGLTKREAVAQGDRHHSLMAFVIGSAEKDSEPLGVIYLEAEGINVLLSKPVAELEKALAGDPNGRTVADKDADEIIWQPLWKNRKVAPLVRALRKLRMAFNWDKKVNLNDGR